MAPCIELYDFLEGRTVTRLLPDDERDDGGLRTFLRPDAAAKALMARHARVLAETFGAGAEAA